MKKTRLIAALTAVTIIGLMLTSCGSTKGNNASAGTTAATSAQTTTASETTTSATTETSSESEAAPEEVPQDAANPLQPAVDAALGTGEWPAMMEVADTQIINDYFGIDVEAGNYDGYIFMQCPMSANLTEIIVIKSSDVDAAKSALEARQKKAQEADAFYPADVERAGASIVGTEGNYAYFIMADAAADAEPMLVDALKAM